MSNASYAMVAEMWWRAGRRGAEVWGSGGPGLAAKGEARGHQEQHSADNLPACCGVPLSRCWQAQTSCAEVPERAEALSQPATSKYCSPHQATGTWLSQVQTARLSVSPAVSGMTYQRNSIALLQGLVEAEKLKPDGWWA